MSNYLTQLPYILAQTSRAEKSAPDVKEAHYHLRNATVDNKSTIIRRSKTCLKCTSVLYHVLFPTL